MRKVVLLLFFLVLTQLSVGQIIIKFFPPAVTTQPAVYQTICNGSTANLSIAVSGSPTITFQWYSNPRNGCEFCDTQLVNGSQFSGVNTPTLRINTTGFFGGGTYYWCLVSSQWGTAYSNDASIGVASVPLDPTTTGASSCTSASLILSANAGPKYFYNWYNSDGSQIKGQTGPTYTTPVLSSTTTYYVAATTGTCESAWMPVTASINTVTPPTTTGGFSCGTGIATLTASGGSAGQYRWYTATGLLIAGQNNNTYSPTISSTTTYYVAINNGICQSNATPVTATFNAVPSPPGTTGNAACGPTATVTLTSTGGTAGQYRWYTAAGALIAGQTNNTYTPTISVTTNYSVSINNGTCESTKTPVTAVINTTPAAPGATGNAACGPTATVTLTATGGTAGQYRWYTAAGVLIAGQTSNTYSPTVSVTTNYSVTINNGTCESAKTPVIATINILPTAPGATGNSACGPTAAVTLNATGGTAGQYRWYTSAGVIIAGQTNATYSPTISTTTSYSVAINNGTCESTKTSVTATINIPPTAPGATGNAACGPTATITLTATGGTAGQYRWYTAAGVLIAGQTSNTYSPTVSVTTSYSVTINNGTCESAKTPVIATINILPTAPGATGNSACGPTAAVTLNATGGTAGQYRWYTAAGVVIAGQTNATYSPTISTTTSYSVAINNGTCESTKTSATATINTPPTAPGATGNAACGPTATITLTATGGTAGQYRWYTAAGVIIAGQTSAVYAPTISATTSYSVAINNGTCESTKTAITAVINIRPTPPGTTGASSCTPASLILTASGGASGQYRWYTAASALIAGETNSTFSTPIISTSTTYLVAINNGICESTTTPVGAQINSASSSPATTGGYSCGPGNVVVSASGGSAGEYRWYSTATGGSPISGEVNSTYTTPSLAATTTYYVSTNNGVCESGRNSVVAQINPIPANPGANASSGCSGTTITLKASGGASGQYRWYTAATGGTAIDGQYSSNYVTPALVNTSTYYVSINDGSCESSRVAVIATVNDCSNNLPPVITTVNSETFPGGVVTINLQTRISDPDNNLDLTTLKIIVPPASGAIATINGAFSLKLDYTGLTFSGVDKVTIEVCDLFGSCTRQEFSISVEGNILVYNGISPNGDGKNDHWIIERIDILEETKSNHVSIFNRWGDSIFEVDNYDNLNRVFAGLSKNGDLVPAGTYYYKIEYKSGRKPDVGYFSLKR